MGIGFLFSPHRIRRTGDDSPAGGLAAYVWRMSGWHQIVVCVLAGLVAALTVVPVDLQRRLVDEAIGGRDRRLLAVLGAIYLGVVLLKAGLKYVLRVYQGWLSESAIRYTREHLSGYLSRRGQRPETAEGGDAVTVIGQEVERVGSFVGTGFSNPVTNAGMVLAILGYMLVVQPLVALASMVLLLPQLIVAPWLQRKVNRLVERRVPLLRGLGEQVSAGGEEIAPSAIEPLLDRIFRNRMAIYLTKFLLKGTINLANNLAPLGVLVVGGWFVLEGATTVGVVVAFVSGFERLGDPLRQLVAYYRTASRTRIQHRLIAQWMRADG